MIFKLPVGEVTFRNPQILDVDTKQVVLERVLTNLFMLIYADGANVKLKNRKEFNIDNMIDDIFRALEQEGKISGVESNRTAVLDWLRSSLLEIVNRGNMQKEKVASVRPVHLLSFRVQNRRYCRDYSTADQLYLMLKAAPDVLTSLRKYLSIGWDKDKKEITPGEVNDVDTAGILLMSSKLRDGREPNDAISFVKPLLPRQADLFNDDVRRLLAYKDVLPRSVFIEYLKIICGLHLALYSMKVVLFLPQMVKAGTTDIPDDWSMVVDLTGNLDSKVSRIACRDMERLMNAVRPYIKATYMINLAQRANNVNRGGCSVDKALDDIKQGKVEVSYMKGKIVDILDKLNDKNDKEFDKEDLYSLMEYYDDDDYFGKYVHLLEVSNLGYSQFKFFKNFIDSVSMKNKPSMLMADGRSRRRQRRGAIGPKMLETMVQLLLLQPKDDGGFESRSLSVNELVQSIRSRYGLIINGVGEARFESADVETYAAFEENVSAFKDMLRQSGFYSDLSDACILQRIRPRYKI